MTDCMDCNQSVHSCISDESLKMLLFQIYYALYFRILRCNVNWLTKLVTNTLVLFRSFRQSLEVKIKLNFLYILYVHTCFQLQVPQSKHPTQHPFGNVNLLKYAQQNSSNAIHDKRKILLIEYVLEQIQKHTNEKVDKEDEKK